MSIDVSQSLCEFFEREAGPALRLVGHYTRDSVDLVYLREDLEDAYDEDDFRRTFGVHREDKAAALKQQSVIDAGNHHCTLRLYDEAIVFNFAQTGDVGTVVSVDPDVGQNLLTFVTRSLERLHTDSAQEVTAPEWVGE